MGMERNRDRDRDAWRDKGNRERPKGERRKSAGWWKREEAGGEEQALVMLCDLGQVPGPALCV